MAALTNVLWLGGAPGAGKTTVARRLARRHGLRWYNADAHTWEHRDRALREGNAAAARWEALSPRERWVETAPADMLPMSLSFERWTMIADDVRALPRSPLVLAEGSTVLPELVAAGVAEGTQALWLMPSREVQVARLEGRDPPAHVESDARRARDNVIELCLLLGAELERRVREHGVRSLPDDGTAAIDEVTAAVEAAFADALAAGPRAGTAEERRALVREGNDAIVAQVRGYLARPWATGDEEAVVREFTCECDDAECRASVALPVAAFARAAADGPVLADGHG